MKRAIEELLRHHGPALVLWARQWVRTHADAEDVIQNAFLRFWRSRSNANDQRAYLFACVKTAALDWQRGNQRRIHREESAARPEAEEPLFRTSLEQKERSAVIESALWQLPEDQRQVLILKIWGSLTFPQIAQTLEIPANTAASRYRYALDKLREVLAQETIP